ncbi:MobH family relaxase [uncultured Cardiobacterium sp.]|uniref:MobH family relaxase n=1 Tax=uncultured Cardiobacterium sp. TaxID=417619 RepID=UPI00260C5F52|nr:MobH family relaxase [uncultured Cardiobacterium sp.]
MMGSGLLRKLFQGSASAPAAAADAASVFPVLAAEALYTRLSLHNRLRGIRRKVAIDPQRFEAMYGKPIAKYCETVQLLPASQAHHHAYPGGLIVHTLSVIEYAINERQKYTLPLASEPEVIEAQKNLWTYAVFVAALLHDIGKALTMAWYIDAAQDKIRNPAAGTLLQQGCKHYTLKFRPTAHYQLHERLGLLFLPQLLDSISLDYLTRDLDIFSEVLGYVSADRASWGSIGAIVSTADQMSVAADLRIATQTGRPRQFAGADIENFGERLLKAFRLLIEERKLAANRPGAVLYLSDDQRYVYAVAKTIAEKLREKMQSLGATDVPADNTRIFDELQQHGLIEATANGQAVFTIHVSIPHANFEQDFTTLKIDSRKLFTVASLPAKMSGSVSEGGKAATASAPDNPPATAAAAAQPLQQPVPTPALQQEATAPVLPQGTQEAAVLAQEAVAPIVEILQQDVTGGHALAQDGLPPELQLAAAIDALPDDPFADPPGVALPVPAVADEMTPPPVLPVADAAMPVPADTPAHKPPPDSDPQSIVDGFFAWLWQKIAAKNIIVNRSGQPAFVLEYENRKCLAVVSPKTFADYARDAGLFAKEGTMSFDDMRKAAQIVQSAIHKRRSNIPAGSKQIHYCRPVTAQGANAKLSLYFFEAEKIQHPPELQTFLDKCEVSTILI